MLKAFGADENTASLGRCILEPSRIITQTHKSYRKNDGRQEKRGKARLAGLSRKKGLDARKQVKSKCNLASNDLWSWLRLNGSRGSSLHRAQVSASDSQPLNSVTWITAHGDSH